MKNPRFSKKTKMDYKELAIFFSLIVFVNCTSDEFVNLTEYSFNQNIKAERAQLVLFYHQG